MKLKLFIVIFLFIGIQQTFSKVVINEVVSLNNESYIDVFDQSSDWIELFNSGEDTVNLKNWILTDEEYDFKWKFPEIILPPDSFLIVCCSDYNLYYNGELHTNFKLNNDGETIFLYSQYFELVDKITIPELYTDYSFGRFPDGEKEFVKFIESSPGKSNIYGVRAVDIVFSKSPGFYDNEVLLALSATSPGCQIYYTLNGNTPDTNSYKYESPIILYDRTNEPNTFSMIRTNPEDANPAYRWKQPQTQIFKINTIKAVVYKDGRQVSPVYANSYLIFNNHRKFTFPVISITTDSVNLFGYEQGIYIPGLIHDIDTLNNGYWGSGNYHQRGDEWERPAHIEFFEKDGSLAFSQDVGIRIHGSGGRALPEKSLRIYARKEYGQEKINYKVFPNSYKTEFKRLILRNSGQDFMWTMFADALIQMISKNTGIEYQDYRPAIVFINGEYWGIHNIRERYDEYYFQELTGVSEDYISIYDGKLLHDPYIDEHFNEMYEFMLNNDLSIDENYVKVSYYIDVYNTVNYLVQKIFFGAYDWPSNNIKLWRAKIYGSKWRWLSYDNDHCLMYPDINFFLHSFADTSKDWRNPPWSTFVFRKLAENERFRTLLVNTFRLRVQTVYSVENVLNKIDEFEQFYEPEMQEHIDRWGYPGDFKKWKSHIWRMRNYVNSCSDKWEDRINEFLKFVEVDDIDYETNLAVFPNPTDGIVNIVNIDELVSVEVYDYLGNEIKSFDIVNFGNSAKINLTQLKSGIYYLKIITNKELKIKKIVKY